MRIKYFVGAVVLAALWFGPLLRPAAAGADEGKKVFEAKKCINCHSLGEQKGPMAKLGGPLDDVGSKRDTAWLKAYLANPKSKMPDAKMPKMKYTDQELDALAQYMATLKK